MTPVSYEIVCKVETKYDRPWEIACDFLEYFEEWPTLIPLLVPGLPISIAEGMFYPHQNMTITLIISLGRGANQQ